MKDLLLFAVGFIAGGAATAASAKLLGWFNKQEASIRAKLP